MVYIVNHALDGKSTHLAIWKQGLCKVPHGDYEIEFLWQEVPK